MLIFTRMKRKITEKLEIPAGIKCEYSDGMLKCRKDNRELSRKIDIVGASLKIEGSSIIFNCEKGNKKNFKIIKSYVAHVRNMFKGLEDEFVYKLQAANVHFPMSLKVEGDKLAISNFLGEKKKRYGKILPSANVEVKGQDIIIKSSDKEAAGKTAANIEKATKIRKRDRRIFQDGIFLVARP